MTDYSDQWQVITKRWGKGRRNGLLHLLVSPLVLYGLSFPIKQFAPDSWLIGGEPVWYFIVAFAFWLLVFIGLLWRDRYYTCPQCATKVRPFGGSDIPNFRPHPCPKCGLKAPDPPYD